MDGLRGVKEALLLSGGMDSISLAWWRRPMLAVTIDYGQLAAQAEISAASSVARELNTEHLVLQIDCRALGSGDMAGSRASVHAPVSEWWPYRNQLLITFAAARCLDYGVKTLLLGTVRSDEAHKDGTPQFISAMSRLLALQEGEISVEAPAIGLTAVELIRKSSVPSSVLAWAHSCHKASVACGDCRGCNKYFDTFQELGYDLDRPG
jgi:7-cyano-7-deazaguanine synthase